MTKVRFPIIVRRGSVSMKIYRVKHQTTADGFAYTLAWHAGGVRLTKQFTDVEKAREEAGLKADQLSSGKIEAARTTTVEDAATLAELRKLAGDVPPAAALTEWLAARKLCGGQLIPAAKAWRDAHAGQRQDITVPDAVELFLKAKDRQGVDTKASYRKILPRLKEGFPGQPISGVTSRALEAWIHKAFRVGDAENVHPSTHNTVRTRLVSLWRWCRSQGYLPRNAQTEAEQVGTARELDAEIGILTVAAFARVLELMRTKHPEHLAAAVIAGLCGLRRSEIHAQKWSDVHLDRAHVRVSSAKRNTPAKRLVPLCSGAIEWLMLCKRPKGEVSEQLVAPPWAIDRIRAFAREAGIACPDNGFRHSFISYRVAQTGNVAETALEAGNSPAIVHKHYRELVAKDDGAAWFALTPTVATKVASEHAGKVVGIA